jgi:hypothetical protein
MNKYFVYDADNNDFETYATIEEQSKAAEEMIGSYMDCDGAWAEEVEGIVLGVITESASVYNRIDRPDKKNIDGDGFDEEGRYWPDNVDWFYNYQMEEID